MTSQSPQWLLASDTRLLIHRGDGAPTAGFDDPELHITYLHPLPLVFSEWFASFCDEVRAKTICWFAAVEPERFAPERFPICIHQERDGSSWYVFSTLDEKAVKAAIHSDASVDPLPESPGALDREVHPKDTSRLERWIEETLPDLNPASIRSQVCMYTNTPDEHFLVGRAPGHERTVLLAGYTGHGFKFASVMGEIAADLILEGGTSHPIEQFSPKQFME